MSMLFDFSATARNGVPNVDKFDDDPLLMMQTGSVLVPLPHDDRQAIEDIRISAVHRMFDYVRYRVLSLFNRRGDPLVGGQEHRLVSIFVRHSGSKKCPWF